MTPTARNLLSGMRDAARHFNDAVAKLDRAETFRRDMENAPGGYGTVDFGTLIQGSTMKIPVETLRYASDHLIADAKTGVDDMWNRLCDAVASFDASMEEE